jgi:hypothetical protein
MWLVAYMNYYTVDILSRCSVRSITISVYVFSCFTHARGYSYNDFLLTPLPLTVTLSTPVNSSTVFGIGSTCSCEYCLGALNDWAADRCSTLSPPSRKLWIILTRTNYSNLVASYTCSWVISLYMFDQRTTLLRHSAPYTNSPSDIFLPD